MDNQFMYRPFARDRNNFDGNASQGGGESASRVTGHVDLPRHQAAHADYPAHHKDLQIESLLTKESFFLPVIQRHIAQRRTRNADVKTLGCKNMISKSQQRENEHDK